jgi:uncharacterized membrane protein
MSSVSTIITIHKPLQKAFDYFFDETKMSQWVTGFQKIELIRGESKKQHSKYIMTVQYENRPVALVQELVEIIDNQYIYLRTEHPDWFTYSEITFQSVDTDVTRLNCVCKIHGKGFKVRMMMPVVRSIFETRQWRDYKKFRELVEAK